MHIRHRNQNSTTYPDGLRTPHVRLVTSVSRYPENDLEAVTGDGEPDDTVELNVDRALYVRRSGAGSARFYFTEDRGESWEAQTTSNTGPMRVTTYASTGVYPAAVVIRQWLDLTGAGGACVLPASEGLSVMDACAVCCIGGAVTLSTPDGATINGSATFVFVGGSYEQYVFFWTGVEWRASG